MTELGELLERIVRFQHNLLRRRSTLVAEFPWGYGVRHARFPASYDHNKVVVTSRASADDVVAASDRFLCDGDHRQVEVLDDGIGADLARGLVAAGYRHSRTLVMTALARAEKPPPAVPVVAVPPAELRPALEASWCRELPGVPADVLRQLSERGEANEATLDVTYLAVRGTDGRIAARADLYVDGDLAQVEDVMTEPEQRGRGLASALVLAGIERARAAGAGQVFLLADADDWPRLLYARLGFVELGVQHGFQRI